MRFRRRNHVIQILVLLSLFSASVNNRAQVTEKKRTISRTVIFAVSEGGDVTIDPIVIIDRGRYLKPPDGIEEDAGHFHDTPQSSQFAAKYYRAGQTYQLLFGGGKVGTASVIKRTSKACSSLAAAVRLQTSQKIGGWVMALAADSSLGFGESSRRAPSPNERSTVLELAVRTYRRRRVPASLIKGMKVTNLTAVDLDRDGNPELVGSFRIEQDRTAYLLFLIVDKHEGNYSIALQRYDEGLEDGEDFVDELDLDGDGIGEVITQVSGSEVWTYSIYKRKAGRWQLVYKGGGGGC